MTSIQQFPDRWEQGSEFHWLADVNVSDVARTWAPEGNLYASGRDAMRALLTYGREQLGWQRLWIPSYFCQEVVSALGSSGLSLQIYPDSPIELLCDFDQLSLRASDVLLQVNFFGLRSPSRKDPSRDFVILEDHTHDPWSEWAMNSSADWCVVSLRKTLPVPDGGMLWSPRAHPLPIPVLPKPECMYASLEKLAAMLLKHLYLQGYEISKETFRQLQISGERHILAEEISGMSIWTRELLKTFPIGLWRSKRRANHRVFTNALKGIDWLDVLQPSDPSNGVPFSGILVFDSMERRDHVRQCLIAANVYPAVLWPLEKPVLRGVPQEHIEFSRRMLSIHCDMRYDEIDMQRVAEMIRKFGDEYGSY